MARLLVLALALTLCAIAPAVARPLPPVWPASFEMDYTITLPYVSSVQPQPLTYPVHVWYKRDAALMRMSFYDGLDDIYVSEDATYNLYPRILTRTCMYVNTTPAGPTTHTSSPGLWGNGALPPPLPDITNWEYAGMGHIPGKPPSYVWQLTLKSWEKVATYTFHVQRSNGHPVHLDMMGVNLLTGSHFDQYVVDFGNFMPLYTDRAFQPPKLCKHVQDGTAASKSGRMALQQALSLLPGVAVPSHSAAAPDERPSLPAILKAMWSGLISGLIKQPHAHTAVDEDDEGDDESDTVLDQNLRFIREWNAGREARLGAQQGAQQGVQQGAQQGAREEGVEKEGGRKRVGPVAAEDVHTLGVNKFVGWSDERWQATMLGHTPPDRRRGGLQSFRSHPAHLGTFKRQLSARQLPASVDWRGTGADGPVKDQASCGSCWTFATTGAMTGAWYLATNESISFSEQQIVDCSWDYDVNGCWGGWVEPALTYIYDRGGVASESSYPYRGQNGMCRENSTAKAAMFQGFLSVPEKDEEALMEAVARYGPVAISFDAGHPTFKYYSEGVYYREDCGNDADHLNHAVTLVGYGTTPGGTDYWLLRNSWSQFWGDGGYFKMSRKGNDCGVTVDAVIAVADDSAAAQTRARLQATAAATKRGATTTTVAGGAAVTAVA